MRLPIARASGASGVLRVGYQWAADLGSWALASEPRIPREFVVRTKILREHGYWMGETPLDLVLHLGPVEWIWRDIAIERDGEDLVVRLAESPIVEKRSAPVGAAEGAR